MVPTLDEIEAASNRIATRKSEWAPEMLAEITAELLRGLVAHVRALGVEGDVRRHADRLRITALEEKVAALEFNEAEAAELVAEDAAKAKDVVDRVMELDRLRAENAELQAKLRQPARCIRRPCRGPCRA